MCLERFGMFLVHFSSYVCRNIIRIWYWCHGDGAWLFFNTCNTHVHSTSCIKGLLKISIFINNAIDIHNSNTSSFYSSTSSMSWLCETMIVSVLIEIPNDFTTTKTVFKRQWKSICRSRCGTHPYFLQLQILFAKMKLHLAS